MEKLIKTSILVKEILEDCPDARNDDDLLYLQVCLKRNPSIDMFPFGAVFRNSSSFFIPSYKSVERARRKVQEKHPELASNKKVKVARTEEETKYKAFAREGVI